MSLKLTRYGKAGRVAPRFIMLHAAGLPRLRAQLSSTLGLTEATSSGCHLRGHCRA